ncbi:MAG: cytochrome-c peroxidase, partial [Bacteroidia bacterium]
MKGQKLFLKPALAFLAISLFVIVCALFSCGKKAYTPPPLPGGLKPTATNPWLPSKPYEYPKGSNDLATLGRVLFYDKNLSADNSVSCGSCHQQAYGFADNKQFSTGFGGAQTPRNAHSIMQTNNSHFWDGKNQLDFSQSFNQCTDYTCQSGGPSFTSPVAIPFLSHVELNMDMQAMVNKIATLPYYSYLFPKAFNGHNNISVENVELAIGTFMQNVSVANNKFSRVKAGTDHFTASEQSGYNIFNGKGYCSKCHIEANGFAGNPGQFEDIGLDQTYSDLGRGSVTNLNSDRGRFHVPSLINISFTAPYMHDGRFRSLTEVINFFDSGVQASPNLSSAMTNNIVPDFNGGYAIAVYPPHSLVLTASEKTDLLAFLSTLSDPSVLTDIRY